MQRLWRKLQLLRGLTNAGHPKVLDVIEPYLNDRSEFGKYIRVAALQTMRMNKSPEASAVFLDALLREDSFYVKNRAVPLIADMVLTRISTTASGHFPRKRTETRIGGSGTHRIGCSWP